MLIILFFLSIFAKSELVVSNINLDTIDLNTSVFYQFELKNNDLGEIKILNVDLIDPNNAYSLVANTSTILENGTIEWALRFTPKTNIDYESAIFISYEQSKVINYKIIQINAFGKLNDYYNSTNNLFDSELKNALHNLVKDHTFLTYRDARIIMFEELNNDNGVVECVYTGEKLAHTTGIPDVNTTKFNTEHTWPQSLGAENEPARSDMHHIFPTNETANSRRGNFPFDFLNGNPSWENGDSKLGFNKNNQQVFEVRDIHKGNTARAMFYFALRYQNPTNYLNTYENSLREWTSIDSVDESEYKRNEKIFAVQKNRNPFVDHPQFLNRITSLSENIESEKYINVYAGYNLKLEYPKNKLFTIDLINSGNKFAKINSMKFENDLIELKDSIRKNQIPFEIITFNFEAKIEKFNTSIKFAIDGIDYTINVEFFDGSTNVSENSEINLYPNPTDEFINVNSKERSLILIDSFGRNYIKNIENGKVDLREFSAGVYFINLENKINKIIIN